MVLNVPVVVGLKDNWPELLGFISSLDGSTSAPVSIINSCFVSVGFWIFIILFVFAAIFNMGFVVPVLTPIHLYIPGDSSFVDNWIVLDEDEDEDEEDEEEEDAAAVVPDVWGLTGDWPYSAFAIGAMRIEFPCQLSDVLNTSIADSIEANTTRASSVFLFIVFNAVLCYYKISPNTICWIPRMGINMIYHNGPWQAE